MKVSVTTELFQREQGLTAFQGPGHGTASSSSTKPLPGSERGGQAEAGLAPSTVLGQERNLMGLLNTLTLLKGLGSLLVRVPPKLHSGCQAPVDPVCL